METLPKDIALYLDDLFEADPGDQALANNGLQIDCGLPVTKIGLAVDGCLDSFMMAKDLGCNMILAHHGIFWTGHGTNPRAINIHGKRLSYAFNNGISLWSCHLPLDIQPEFGNNAVLARILELGDIQPFGQYNGKKIGFMGKIKPSDTDSIATRLEEVLPECTAYAWNFGRETIETVGIVSGGGDFAIPEAGQLGVDLIVTGEMGHELYHVAKEYGVNVICAGHWSTETTGIRAVGEKVGARFGLLCEFLSIPTGL
jgi:dinuclear metal center YbgI/SA1388 family protein